jgi:L-lactate dehydrogenase (cytochrome)
MNMRLIGARNLKEIIPEMVDARNLSQHIVAVPGDRLYDTNCESRSVLTFFSS